MLAYKQGQEVGDERTRQDKAKTRWREKKKRHKARRDKGKEARLG